MCCHRVNELQCNVCPSYVNLPAGVGLYCRPQHLDSGLKTLILKCFTNANVDDSGRGEGGDGV